MQLYDLLRLAEPGFDPRQVKVHLARPVEGDQPLDLYFRGEFDDWQTCQTRHNFNRPFVVSLTQVPGTYRWLFAGIFRVGNYVVKQEHRQFYYYELDRLASTADFEGRLIVSSSYTNRQSFLLGETLADVLPVHELMAHRMTFPQFPGFKQVNISKQELDAYVEHGTASWRTALSSVKGIYLITDTKTGKLYVGKADGEGGIWARWCQYAATGHGFNKALMDELGIKASERQNDLRFSLLEIADIQSGPGEIERRESHWKQILLSRMTGYNRN